MKKILLLLLLCQQVVLAQTGYTNFPGYPSRDASLDALPGFRNPPPGYGEVPFWWWTGDTLDVERMLGQIRELSKKGISGVQVNYSHLDTPGWMTEQDNPHIFTDAWWKIYSRISEECFKYNMGIGLSTYTIDWPRGAPNLFYQLFYRKEWLNAHELKMGKRLRIKGGESASLTLTSEPVVMGKQDFAESTRFTVRPQRITVKAYAVKNGKLQKGARDLSALITNEQLRWTAPEGEWEIIEFLSVRRPGTMNPLLPGSGDTIVHGYFQQFQDKKADKSSAGLNYFFNDELHIGLGKFAWHPSLADSFRIRKGYDLFDLLPAMWEDMGDVTAKLKMDYADVRMALMEERYFQPIYNWHASRGMIFGCDSETRGLSPDEFGDYFRATRWYSAPGHDTPGGKADPIKGRVSSSIANLYQRPRVWLEGYHSLGWGATPEQLMFATRENYLYGCTLFNLHGLYYTTYGSHWEWAPPCYHFRMPYWDHMGVFLKYFERLSYLMSQGHVVADVAIVYPVAAYEAEMDGDSARNTAFALGRELLKVGINFEFIDHESLSRAVVENGHLVVKDANTRYKALIFPNMKAVRWGSIEKAADFAQNGGGVYALGALPQAADKAGANDPELQALNQKAFAPQHRFTQSASLVRTLSSAFTHDLRGMGKTLRTLHRKVGPRDVYLVMDADPGSIAEFRAKGAVELWDPWTGDTRPLRVTGQSATGTLVELPLQPYEATIVVFTPGKPHVQPIPDALLNPVVKTLPNNWTVRFQPTMDNSHGDFRMPVTSQNKTIGVEARTFQWTTETSAIAKTAMLPATSDASWKTIQHGFGTQFYVLGPLPDKADLNAIEKTLSAAKNIDLSKKVSIGGKEYSWMPYDFSWRWGKQGDQGHQGYHGLKRTVTNDFICLGKPEEGLNEIRYINYSDSMKTYLVWTTATVAKPANAALEISSGSPDDKSHSSPILTPSAIYVDGKRASQNKLSLTAGTHPILMRYASAGRGHLVLRDLSRPVKTSPQPLSMKWFDDPSIIPFDVQGGKQTAEWFRFHTAPGTERIHVQARGSVEAWINGQPMQPEGNGTFRALKPVPAAALIALRVKPSQSGITGGELIPEPVRVETSGKGIMPLGDWSKQGILKNYSGGVRYATSIRLNAEEAAQAASLDLGKVAGTAEVFVNGKSVAVKVAPPWKVDIAGSLKAGDNTIEVLVYNTLANHYQTIPSRYKGDPVSGLLQPVKLYLSPLPQTTIQQGQTVVN